MLATAKLIVVVPVLDFGGIETQTVIHLRSMRDVFESVRVCCFRDDGQAAEEIRRLGVPVDVLNTSPSVRNATAPLRLRRYLRRYRPDIVHARTGAMTVHGLLASASARVPVRIAEEVGIPGRGRLGQLVFPLVYRLASAVIGVSDSVTRFLNEEDGVPAGRAVRLYNTIDASFFELPTPRMDGPFRILTVGRLVPVKGHEVLVRAVAPMLREGGCATLTVVGDGPERPRLEGLVEQLGIAESVEFAGHRKDVARFFKTASVFVLPSCSEGLPLALVEAMASQVPVIATSVGGVPEAIAPGAEQWLVAAGDEQGLRDALQRVRSLDAAQRRQLGHSLRDHAWARFSPDQYRADLIALYERLLANSRSTA